MLKYKQIDRHSRIQLQPKSTNSLRQLQKRKAQKAVTAQRVSSNEQARKQNKRRVHKCTA
jgi:hypothetical protein